MRRSLVLFAMLLSACSSETAATNPQCDGTADGDTQSRVRYRSAQPVAPDRCEPETQTRNCTNGTWGEWRGTFTAESCNSAGAGCGITPDGKGETRPCYAAEKVPANKTCSSTLQTRSCVNGTWSPDWPTCDHLSCSVEGQASCGSTAHGNNETRPCYVADTVPYDSTCSSTTQTRTCMNGTWSPDWPACDHLSCSVQSGASCGTTLHGKSETRPCYAADTVPYGSNCSSTTQSRTCANGTWSPDWPACDHLSCTVSGAASCGNTLDGLSENRNCFAAAAMPASQTCSPTVQSRTCHNGVWSPDYPSCPALSCRVMPAVLSVAAGEAHTCAILAGGVVKCWGANYWGTLGLGDTANRGDNPNEMGTNLPVVDLDPGSVVGRLSAGNETTCALFSTDAVKCWGWNGDGVLGVEDTVLHGSGPDQMGSNLPFVNLGTNKTAISIAVGDNHVCAVLNDNMVKCWGSSNYGEGGRNDTAPVGTGISRPMGDSLSAVALGTGRSAIAVAAGGHHSCALLNGGDVKCWGSNDYGQLGQGTKEIIGDGCSGVATSIRNCSVPVDEMGDHLSVLSLGAGRTATSISAGPYHTCALLDNGSVKCWGRNSDGQLGLGDTDHRGDGPNEMGDALPAIDLGANRTALQIDAAGTYNFYNGHTCALLDNHSMKCWGENRFHQLGQGFSTDSRGDAANEMGDNLPALELGDTVTSMSAGGSHTCALLASQAIKCWGVNFTGELGLGDTSYHMLAATLPFVEL
jgi:alpha-tubulin suppressor-like RCC1 family protein